MREVLYKFNTGGVYVTEDDCTFGDVTHLKLTAEPHDFSLIVGGETLRETAFCGCSVVVSREGDAVFYDADGGEIGRTGKGGGTYKEARLNWKAGSISVEFGQMRYIDNYPNCDGEHDRWDEVWQVLRRVTLNTDDGSVYVE